MTLVSRILGFVRESILSRYFGADAMTDAFFTAFRLPNLLRRIFAEGAFSQAFVPILAEYKTQQGEEATRTFLAYVAGMLTLVLALVTALGMLAAPAITWITASGFRNDPAKFGMTAHMLRIVFPYIFLISLSSMGGAILNTWNRFSVPAFVPTLLNVAMIVFALFVSPYCHPPILALAWGVLAGGVLQLVWQLPALKQIGMLVLPRLKFDHAGVWRVMRQMVPAILGVSVAQISLLINLTFASYLPSGSISWMNYADRLMEFPNGLLGVALGTILLPSLSKTFASNDPAEYSRLLDWGLRLCLMLALPASVALAILSGPLIASLLQYGKFNAIDTLKTQYALLAYTVGLSGFLLVKVLAPGFYARQNIRTPVRIAIFTLVLTQLMNLAFIGPLKHAGLALSIGLASCVNAALLYWKLRSQNVYEPMPGWGLFFIKVLTALAVMAAVLFATLHVMSDWGQGLMVERLLRLTAVVAAGLLAYFGSLWALGLRLSDFSRRAA